MNILKLFQQTVDQYAKQLFLIIGEIKYTFIKNPVITDSYNIIAEFYFKYPYVGIIGKKISPNINCHARLTHTVYNNIPGNKQRHDILAIVNISSHDTVSVTAEYDTVYTKTKHGITLDKNNENKIINNTKNVIFKLFEKIRDQEIKRSNFYFLRPQFSQINKTIEQPIEINVTEYIDNKIKTTIGDIIQSTQKNEDEYNYKLKNNFILQLSWQEKNKCYTLTLSKIIEKTTIIFFKYRLNIEIIEDMVEFKKLEYIIDHILTQTINLIQLYHKKITNII